VEGGKGRIISGHEVNFGSGLIGDRTIKLLYLLRLYKGKKEKFIRIKKWIILSGGNVESYNKFAHFLRIRIVNF